VRSEHCSLPVSTPGSRSATSRKQPRTPTREPPCATTGPHQPRPPRYLHHCYLHRRSSTVKAEQGLAAAARRLDRSQPEGPGQTVTTRSPNDRTGTATMYRCGNARHPSTGPGRTGHSGIVRWSGFTDRPHMWPGLHSDRRLGGGSLLPLPVTDVGVWDVDA
jgi:hypothetical protein